MGKRGGGFRQVHVNVITSCNFNVFSSYNFNVFSNCHFKLSFQCIFKLSFQVQTLLLQGQVSTTYFQVHVLARSYTFNGNDVGMHHNCITKTRSKVILHTTSSCGFGLNREILSSSAGNPLTRKIERILSHFLCKWFCWKRQCQLYESMFWQL